MKDSPLGGLVAVARHPEGGCEQNLVKPFPPKAQKELTGAVRGVRKCHGFQFLCIFLNI